MRVIFGGLFELKKEAFQRVMTAIEGKPLDRIPVIPQITYTTAQLTGIQLIEALHSPEKTAIALLTGQQELGYDAIYTGWESSFNLLAEAMGCTMRFPENDVPQVADNIVKNPSDLDKVIIPDPHHTGRLPIHMKTVELVKEKVTDNLPLFCYVPGPFTLAGQLCGVNQLMLATLRNPKFVHEITKLTSAASIRYAEANIAAGINVIVAADPTASSSLISPEMFSTYAAPRLKEVFSAVYKAGAIPSLHICGQTTPILEMMCATGAKILEIDHLVDLGKAKQKVGHKVCLMGNIDPTEILLNGTTAEVEKAVKLCIRQAAEGGRYILSSGCEIPPTAPLENIRAMVNATEKFGRYD
jgi:uroporphyrinogen decarboxylase